LIERHDGQWAAVEVKLGGAEVIEETEKTGKKLGA